MPFAIKTQANEPGAIVITDDQPGEVGRFLHVTLHSFERRMTEAGDIETKVIEQDEAVQRFARILADVLNG